MIRLALSWTLFLHLSLASLFQEEHSTRILTPVPGEVLQGLIAIEGDVLGEGLESYELAFSSQEDPTQTWFILARGENPVSAGLLGEWDTTTLTDGEYALRLVANFADGERQEFLVSGLRVRNYSPVETSTPSPEATLEPGQVPTATPTSAPPSVTPYAENPAQSSPAKVEQALWFGIIAAPIILVTLGLYSLRKAGQR